MRTLIIAGSPRKNSYTNVLAKFAYDYAKEKGKEVDLLDLSKTQLDPFRGFGENYSKETVDTIESIKKIYNLLLIATPVYDSGFSSAIKNIFEHSNYKELKGKTAGFIIMASGKISHLLVHTQLNAMMNYFGIFSNPKGVYAAGDDFKEMTLTSEIIKERIKDLVDSSVEIAEKLSG